MKNIHTCLNLFNTSQTRLVQRVMCALGAGTTATLYTEI